MWLFAGMNLCIICLPLDEAMLTTPDDFLVLHMPGNGFQNYLPHHLPRDQGETDWTIVPGSSFLIFSKIGVTFAFL